MRVTMFVLTDHYDLRVDWNRNASNEKSCGLGQAISLQVTNDIPDKSTMVYRNRKLMS